jgi:putative NADH-flavin reductase
MKLLILGSTGATGNHLLELALAGGHEVTALVRDPKKLATKPSLTVLGGRATVASDVEPAARGQDAVVSALGPRETADPVCAEAAEAVVTAMKKAGVDRVVWLSAGGVGDSKPQIVAASFVFGRIIMPLFLKKPYANHLKAEETLRASGLSWTVVRPLQLVDAPTGNATAAVPVDGTTKVSGLKISRRDVAAFMLRAAVEGLHVREMPLLHA